MTSKAFKRLVAVFCLFSSDVLKFSFIHEKKSNRGSVFFCIILEDLFAKQSDSREKAFIIIFLFARGINTKLTEIKKC